MTRFVAIVVSLTLITDRKESVFTFAPVAINFSNLPFPYVTSLFVAKPLVHPTAGGRMGNEHDLRKRFGRLVAAHRKRMRMTQEALAAAAELSPDMIGRIENGVTGARFPSIERIAAALKIDPAELFTTEARSSSTKSKHMLDLTARLATLSDHDVQWVERLLDAALKPRG